MPTDTQPEQVKNHIADATEMVQPVPLIIGRDQLLAAFDWNTDECRALECAFQDDYGNWDVDNTLSALTEFTREGFQAESLCSMDTLARIEATMRAHGVKWRE